MCSESSPSIFDVRLLTHSWATMALPFNSSRHAERPASGVWFAVRARFFSSISEHADGERRRPVPDPKVPRDASHRDLSDATLRSDLALGVRRRHAPKSCPKNRSAPSDRSDTSSWCRRTACATTSRRPLRSRCPPRAMRLRSHSSASTTTRGPSACFFLDASEHAEGERQRPAPI